MELVAIAAALVTPASARVRRRRRRTVSKRRYKRLRFDTQALCERRDGAAFRVAVTEQPLIVRRQRLHRPLEDVAEPARRDVALEGFDRIGGGGRGHLVEHLVRDHPPALARRQEIENPLKLRRVQRWEAQAHGFERAVDRKAVPVDEPLGEHRHFAQADRRRRRAPLAVAFDPPVEQQPRADHQQVGPERTPALETAEHLVVALDQLEMRRLQEILCIFGRQPVTARDLPSTWASVARDSAGGNVDVSLLTGALLYSREHIQNGANGKTVHPSLRGSLAGPARADGLGRDSSDICGAQAAWEAVDWPGDGLLSPCSYRRRWSRDGFELTFGLVGSRLCF